MAYITRDKLINLVNMTNGKTNPSLKERFLNKIKKPDKNGCINWKASLSKCGNYGTISISIEGKSHCYKAHRLAYQLFKDEIPRDKIVLHACGNSKCVNHEHLYLGTQKENSRDTEMHGRHNKGERHGMSKLTEKQVKKIKKMKGNDLEIAKIFNVARKTIYDIFHGRSWRHVL